MPLESYCMFGCVISYSNDKGLENKTFSFIDFMTLFAATEDGKIKT